MTNKEVIQLFAKYEPELILECFEDCYHIGSHDGYNDEDNAPDFWSKEWLNDEYDKNFFREQDVERLYNKYIKPWEGIIPCPYTDLRDLDMHSFYEEIKEEE